MNKINFDIHRKVLVEKATPQIVFESYLFNLLNGCKIETLKQYEDMTFYTKQRKLIFYTSSTTMNIYLRESNILNMCNNLYHTASLQESIDKHKKSIASALNKMFKYAIGNTKEYRGYVDIGEMQFKDLEAILLIAGKCN